MSTGNPDLVSAVRVLLSFVVRDGRCDVCGGTPKKHDPACPVPDVIEALPAAESAQGDALRFVGDGNCAASCSSRQMEGGYALPCDCKAPQSEKPRLLGWENVAGDWYQHYRTGTEDARAIGVQCYPMTPSRELWGYRVYVNGCVEARGIDVVARLVKGRALVAASQWYETPAAPGSATGDAGVLTREQAIEACARAGWEAAPAYDFDGEDINQAIEVLAGDYEADTANAMSFKSAVLAEARRLVAEGRCPAMADSPALKVDRG